YLERNDFAGKYKYVDDGIFGGLAAAKPSIFPIYWSRPQMEARQDTSMVAVRGFLNSFWRHESEGRVWFDPTRDTAYPDRVRRREPGTSSGGLSPHTDSGSIERWLLPAYQKVFRHVFDGNPGAYDPWDGAYRTEVHEFESTVMCSAFRTFQGWTALSDMAADQGVLHSVPIPEAIAYLLLRPLLGDVPDEDMCGVTVSRSFPVTERWHSLLLGGVSGIPDVQAGDSVWWHGDMVHNVAPVIDQKGWGNVMYIPAAPWCPRNERYTATVLQALRTGSSPDDFPEEHYERSWQNRFNVDDLNEYGRRAVGLAVSS
ncbi:MAG TPA: YbiU family protein, partial [Ilumatobacteraceae bacterium]